MARILARYKRVKGERWFVSPTNQNYQPSLAFTMQFTAKFAALALALVATAGSVTASPAPVRNSCLSLWQLCRLTLLQVADIVTMDQFYNWLDTTDANITFIGEPIDRHAPRAADSVMVTYCNRRTQNVCGGSCTVYNGGAKCLSAPTTQCLAATANVGFCDRSGCGGSCNQLSTCGTRLDNGFCYTPGTASIIVPPS